jgi:hypothetical protein
MTAASPITPKPTLRWFHLTPGRLLVLLLAVEAILLLSERFRWFPFNRHKGWTVLIAVAAVGLFLLLMLLWFIVSLFFRWHFQFSIRSLLVLTIAVAVPCSWLAVEMKWTKRQKEVVEAIEKMGGRVFYDENFDKATSPPVLVWLREQLGDDFFSNAYSVYLNDTKVTVAGLERLNGLTQLHWLSLRYTTVTDARLEHLNGLTQLHWLDLNSTKVTDAGLEHLKGLTHLQKLDISNTEVTDAGLEHLQSLTQLQRLFLSDTKVTDAGVAKLQKALPNLKIEQK